MGTAILGWKDGDSVATTDEGCIEGWTFWITDGVVVGDSVGDMVGKLVLEVDGAKLGFAEGVEVGSIDGKVVVVGTLVGDSVGHSVLGYIDDGTMLGTSDGMKVGTSVSTVPLGSMDGASEGVSLLG